MVDKINITGNPDTNVDWFADGERANATVLNRPIKQVSQVVNDVIDEIGNVISNEETARLAGDAALQASIDAETTARITADISLQNQIDAEETARITADQSLDTRVTALENSPAASAASDITTVDTFTFSDGLNVQDVLSDFDNQFSQIAQQATVVTPTVNAGYTKVDFSDASGTNKIRLLSFVATASIDYVTGSSQYSITAFMFPLAFKTTPIVAVTSTQKYDQTDRNGFGANDTVIAWNINPGYFQIRSDSNVAVEGDIVGKQYQIIAIGEIE